MKIELSHDLLAKRVYEVASLEQKGLRRSERVVRDRLRLSEEHKDEPWYLSEGELLRLEGQLSKMQLSPAEQNFIARSQKHWRGIRLRHRLFRYASAGVFLSMLLMVLAKWGWDKHQEAQAYEISFKHASQSNDSMRAVMALVSNKTSLAWQHSYLQGQVLQANGFPLRGAQIMFLGQNLVSDADGRIAAHVIYPSLYDQKIEIRVAKLGFKPQIYQLEAPQLADPQTWVLEKQ